ncbi:unnamed protein product [Nippostrongylus brasiliensis]|uniref:tRNA (uracil-O(2)-)-methyltransferase n=1 Tax=Nippostrongylus brasiliensis TaxID=27835 RepID=A0A0N4XXJ2_NIPBR|nr:unnamed protein product [Nippostrongylus brasiliensis]
MLWRTLCDDTANYEFPVIVQDYFDKVISIWRTQCQSVNRRLFGTVLVENGTEEYKTLVHQGLRLVNGDIEPQNCEVRKLISKNPTFSKSAHEVSFSDGEDVVFVPVYEDSDPKKVVHIPFPYKIGCSQASDSSLRLVIAVPANVPDSECRWISTKMFPALLKWLRFIDPKKVVRKTNSLVDLEEYSKRYQRLKENFGRQLVEKWTERTDPKKFVFEDCGIATYLLELWRKRCFTPNKFADLGCGNGLLVYLLNKEGVNGVGIDLRKRKIWSEQLSDTNLIEAAVDPSKESTCVPDDVDFLIGNHTDELTPWIPVMAARRHCGFFVLPCCPFNFHGKYVSRPGDTGSQYDSFLKFVREVCQRLGFVVEEDRLSIPSTKRLCYMGSIPPEGLVPNIEEVIEELTSGSKNDFVPRSKTEQVRNCLNVPKDTRLNLTRFFFAKLLEKDDTVKDGWRCGGAIEIGELAALLTQEQKQLMKQQCGGLQTFLRNQHQVFKV